MGGDDGKAGERAGAIDPRETGASADATAQPKADAQAQPKADAQAPARTDEKTEAKADGKAGAPPPKHAVSLTTWSNTVTSITKAVVAVALAFIAARFVWRDYKHRPLTITIDDDTEKRLTATGANLELRLTLIDDVNTRIRLATAIVNTKAFGDVVSTQDHEDITFKPFGLDASAGDVTKIVRSILDKAPPPLVKITLTPATGDPLASPAPAGKTTTDASPDLNLAIFVKAEGTAQRLTFRVPASGPAARRRLREAMARASEKLLELTSPAVASVVELNHGFFSPFPDDGDRHRQIASALTARLRTLSPDQACMGDIVLGCTEFFRHDPHWRETFRRARAQNVTPTCTIHAQTNLAISDVRAALYQAMPPDQRAQLLAEAASALVALGPIEKSGNNAARVESLRLQVEFFTVWLRGRTGTGWPTSIIIPFLAQVQKEIPVAAGGDPTATHGVFGKPVEVLTSVDPDDIDQHLRGGAALVTAIDGYVHRHPWPRDLYLREGLVYADLARATRRALASSAGAKRTAVDDLKSMAAGVLGDHPGLSGDALLKEAAEDFWRSAETAFENAARAEDTSLPLESAVEMEPLVRLGDTRYDAGDRRGARDAYARAVDAFVEQDEPTRDVLWLAEALGRWATSLIRDGACETPQRIRDPRWERALTALGVTRSGVLCQPPDVLRDGAAEGLGVLGVIGPLLADVLRSCGRMSWVPGVSTGAANDSGAEDVACAQRYGADDPARWTRFTDAHPSTLVDEMLNEALVPSVATRSARLGTW